MLRNGHAAAAPCDCDDLRLGDLARATPSPVWASAAPDPMLARRPGRRVVLARWMGPLLLVVVSACASVRRRPVVTSPHATAPKPAPTAVATPAPPELSFEERLAREVANLRGLPLRRPLVVRRLDEPDFLERIRGQPAAPAAIATYVAFGSMWIDPKGPTATLSSANLGVFDFTTHELLLRRELDEHAARGVLVHEIGHALQDESFGMPPAAEDDRALAIKCLYEGDATLLREIDAGAQEGQSPGDRIAKAIWVVRTNTRELLARSLGVPAEASDHPRFGEMLATYLDGMIFAAALWQNGGFANVDRAYARLPESTEQVLHPEKYVASEAPIVVDAPATPRGHTTLAVGTMGELRTRLLLARCSKTPAVGGWGWGGDRFVVSEGKDKQLALSWRTVWDTEGDAMRFETALRWVSTHCWPSVKRGGWWIGPHESIARAGTRVEVQRGL